jgi:hypothetical protein
MRSMLQQPRAVPEVRMGHLVVMFETGVPCIVEDDDVNNPIRMVNVGAKVESVLAEELVVVDPELFEMVIAARKRGWVV